ncbi:MAG: glycosyltransferase [Clostridia bacterium]|nr:glycosyltransferase [Clostridia bacterium]
MQKKITIILLLLGRPEKQNEDLHRKMEVMQKLSSQAQIIVAGDGPIWNACPLIQMIPTMDGIVFVHCDQNQAFPASVINTALSHVKTEYVMFSLLKDPVESRLEAFSSAIEEYEKQHKEETENDKPIFYINSTAEEYLPAPFVNWFSYDRMQNNERCFGLGMTCTPLSVINHMGAFDESPLLLEEIERWFALAITKQQNLQQAGIEEIAYPSLYEYPLHNHLTYARDLARRYALYCHGIAAPERTAQQNAIAFANDCNEQDAVLYERITGIRANEDTRYTSKYRILILGGVWEYHHNQICFYNYIEKLYGQGFATFTAAYEYDTPATAALNYDLVIFTRTRSENALKIMKFCQERNIPTLYMIDDNWTSIAKDHPDQGEIFMPGKPDYDHFIEALGLCKATWLFNDILKKDILPYTNCVKKFQISVNPDLFSAENPRERKDDEICIGFSGSMRFDDVAFRALARYARRNKKTKIILLGGLSKEQELLFKNIRCERIPFMGYKGYAKNIARLNPDLLIAPLQDTHTSRSKCFNKYVESGVVGIACIYSHVPPYTDVVKEGVNGYYVEEDTEDGWYNKICQVLSDIPTLRKVQQNAKADVMENYSLERVCTAFVSKIQEVIEEDEIGDD